MNNLPHTPSHLYDRNYFLTACEGFDFFSGGADDRISPRLTAALDFVRLEPGDRVLDIGCGRGEFARYLALHSDVTVYGVDYSPDAIAIVAEYLGGISGVTIVQSDARYLPFAARTFDKLFMLDVVEHFYPWELAKALEEAHRVLSNKGQLIIHTAPNRWYYQFGYPVYRLFERIRGNRLPPNPRDRFPYHHLHVNEQDVVRLKRALRKAGFKADVKLVSIRPPLLGNETPVMKLVAKVLLNVVPLKWVFCNDIIAVAGKED